MCRVKRNWIAVGFYVLAGVIILVQSARVLHVQQNEALIKQALEEQARRSELIVESESTAIIMCSEDGTITVSNMSAEQMFGWPHNELIGQKSSVLIPEEFQGKHNEGMRDAAQMIHQYGGNWMITKRGIQLEGITRDGDRIPVSSEIRVIKYGNKVEFIVSMKKMSPRIEQKPLEAKQLPEVLELPTLPPELRRSAK